MKRFAAVLFLLLVAVLPAWSAATTCLIIGPDRWNPGGYWCQFDPELGVHLRDKVHFMRDGAAIGDGVIVQIQTDRQTVHPNDPKLLLHEGDTVVFGTDTAKP